MALISSFLLFQGFIVSFIDFLLLCKFNVSSKSERQTRHLNQVCSFDGCSHEKKNDDSRYMKTKKEVSFISVL